MDRRNFLKRIGLASAGAVVAYSFPEIIVPKNIFLIEPIEPVIPANYFINELNRITLKEIYPSLVNDVFFKDSPFLAYMRDGNIGIYKGRQMGKSTFYELERKLNRRLDHLATRPIEDMLVKPVDFILDEMEDFIDEVDWSM